MVAKPLCPLYKNIIKHLDRARYPELRYILHILYVDAKGKNSLSYSYGGVSNTLLNLTTYKDGVIMSVLKCNFYLQNDADATGTPSFEYPE